MAQPVLTPAEMAAADRRTIEAGTPVEVLMARAGYAVARAAREILGGAYGRRVVVVCGTGNNGGDGLVAARVLRAWGVGVDVFRVAGASDPAFDRGELVRALGPAALAIDAMYGTGFRGALADHAAVVAQELDAARVKTIAVDIPSGVEGLTGAVDGPAVRAQATVTFAALKPGLVFEPGRSHAGVVQVADIGIDAGNDAGAAALVDGADVVAWVPRRDPAAHKWSSGVCVVGGSAGMTGAPMLVSRAAMRAGAGIVWCGVPGDDAAARASGTEVITKALPVDAAGGVDADSATTVLSWLERFRALVVGPGLGTAAPTRAAVRRLVAEAAVPLVLDADGLTGLGGDLAPLRARAAPTIVTPHAGEYERLTGRAVGADRLDAARRLARDAGVVVLLKGPGTVVAEPGGRAVIVPTGGAWLATAGTGDVLSGIVGGFLARGSDPFAAAAGGAWAHGRAADAAGHTGLVAGDLVDALRSVPELESD